MKHRSSTVLIAVIGVFVLPALALGVQAITAEDRATLGRGPDLAESTPTPAGYLPLVSHRVSTFRSPDGDICKIGEECRSGWCTDGVCCDTSCAGTCEACVASLNGGTDGVCGFVTAGTDPDSECGAYYCDGSGVCRTSCTGDTDCQSGYYCGGTNTCVQKGVNGTPCSLASQCVSGYCNDAFCCDRACTGTCEACSASKNGGTDGICGFIPAGWDPDGECTEDCDGNGACESG